MIFGSCLPAKYARWAPILDVVTSLAAVAYALFAAQKQGIMETLLEHYLWVAVAILIATVGLVLAIYPRLNPNVQGVMCLGGIALSALVGMGASFAWPQNRPTPGVLLAVWLTYIQLLIIPTKAGAFARKKWPRK